jgi:hypothetical protein
MYKLNVAFLGTLALALAQPTATSADVCGLKSTEIVGCVIDIKGNLLPGVWVQVAVGRRITCQDGTPIVYYDLVTDENGFYTAIWSSKEFSGMLLVETTIPRQDGSFTSGRGKFEWNDAVCNVSYTVDVVD